LLRAQAADAEGMVFVDEFDSDDWCRGFERDSFADAVVARLLAASWKRALMQRNEPSCKETSPHASKRALNKIGANPRVR
jgi:hypothetical protein